MLLTDLDLEKSEENVYGYIRDAFPQKLRVYMETVPVARFMIMERMVNALLREGFIQSELIETQLANSSQLEFDLKKGKLLISIKERYSYNRFKLEKNPCFLHENGEMYEIFHPTVLLNEFISLNQDTRAYTNLEGFREELSDSVANMGLALLFQKITRENLLAFHINHKGKTIVDLVNQLEKDKGCQFDSSLFFEQLSVSGHFLHPCTKSKIGLNIEQMIKYSAEFDSPVRLHFVAVHKENVYHNPEIKKDAINPFWLEHEPELYQQFQKRCEENGYNLEDFFLFPVHPWQVKHTLPILYKEELESGTILSIPYTMPMKPTLSLRTVLPLTEGRTFHFKLPINIQMTSAVRTVSANSIHNGPELTRILGEVLEKEQHFGQCFRIIGEELGLRFQSKNENELLFRDRSKNLGFLVRRNPTTLVGQDELAIVACAFFNQSPTTGDTLLFEIIEQFHLLNPMHSFEESLLQFFRKYVEQLLAGVIPLMTKYGIGLEAHLQNTLIVIKRWEPVKVLVRDLGGVRVDRSRLEKQGFIGSYYPGSVTINEDEEEMQNKVIHTVFQSHIGEMTYHLASKYNVNEQSFWRIVRETCHELFDQLSRDEKLTNQVEKDKTALFSKMVRTKALTLMRLTDDVTDYAYTKVPNPLTSL